MTALDARSRPTVLFVTPEPPARTGNGLAMRAGLTLRCLAERFDVDVEVVGGSAATPDPFMHALARSWTVQPAAAADPTIAAHWMRDPTWRALAEVLHPLPSDAGRVDPVAAERWHATRAHTVERVHVLRTRTVLAIAPLFRGRRLPAMLDLDDDDVNTYGQLAALAERQGNADFADRLRRDSAAHRRLLAYAAPLFDQFAIARMPSDGSLDGVPGDRLTVVPNVIDVDNAPPARRPGNTVHVLFVGNLTYLPNIDAAHTLAAMVESVSAAVGRPVQLDLVGNPHSTVTRLASASVQVHGVVDDLAPYYARADVVAVPLTAGGGTRIKILEAFGHGVPVVSSTIGADGLDVRHAEHLLLADGERAMVAAIADVVGARRADAAMRARTALDWVRQHHSITAAQQAWQSVYAAGEG